MYVESAIAHIATYIVLRGAEFRIQLMWIVFGSYRIGTRLL
jgi:hypothetical protein